MWSIRKQWILNPYTYSKSQWNCTKTSFIYGYLWEESKPTEKTFCSQLCSMARGKQFEVLNSYRSKASISHWLNDFCEIRFRFYRIRNYLKCEAMSTCLRVASNEIEIIIILLEQMRWMTSFSAQRNLFEADKNRFETFSLVSFFIFQPVVCIFESTL